MIFSKLWWFFPKCQWHTVGWVLWEPVESVVSFLVDWQFPLFSRHGWGDSQDNWVPWKPKKGDLYQSGMNLLLNKPYPWSLSIWYESSVEQPNHTLSNHTRPIPQGKGYTGLLVVFANRTMWVRLGSISSTEENHMKRTEIRQFEGTAIILRHLIGIFCAAPTTRMRERLWNRYISGRKSQLWIEIWALTPTFLFELVFFLVVVYSLNFWNFIVLGPYANLLCWHFCCFRVLPVLAWWWLLQSISKASCLRINLLICPSGHTPSTFTWISISRVPSHSTPIYLHIYSMIVQTVSILLK